MHESMLSNKMNNDGAGAIAIIALRGFNDLGHSVTPISLLMDHFPCRFSMFREKMKKIYLLEV